jgi:uncharacterized protein
MATRQEQITTALDRLSDALGNELSGMVAVSNDGIVLASRMAIDINPDRIGAVAATIIGVTRRVSNELRIGGIEETIIKSGNGIFLVVPAGSQALLAASLRAGANLGLVRLEIRDAAAMISQALG